MSNRLEQEQRAEAKLLEDRAELQATQEHHSKEREDLLKELLLLATRNTQGLYLKNASNSRLLVEAKRWSIEQLSTHQLQRAAKSLELQLLSTVNLLPQPLMFSHPQVEATMLSPRVKSARPGILMLRAIEWQTGTCLQLLPELELWRGDTVMILWEIKNQKKCNILSRTELKNKCED